MVLQIDPRLRVVWRSPSSLQLGVDNPPVVLTDVTSAEERLLAALVVGVSRPALDMLAVAAGADAATASHLLRRVTPALRPDVAPALSHQVTVVGRGQCAVRIADALASSGVSATLVGNDRAAAEPAALAVIVAHFVVDPEFQGLWLRRDVPHLPVVFGDTGALVGPIVEPGTGPCLWCLERRHSDVDPAWPAMASQLWGQRSPVDAGLVADEVAAIATRLVLARLRTGRAGAATSVRLDATSGIRRSVSWQRHPECGCAVLPGSETAGGELSAAVRSPPRSGATAGARA